MPPKDENWNQHKWYKTYDEERRQWDIRFENPKWGNFIGAIPHKEIADHIIELHNNTLPKQYRYRVEWLCDKCGKFNSKTLEDPDICWGCRSPMPKTATLKAFEY